MDAKQSHSPDLERLSMLTATILLVYAMTQFIREPVNRFSLQLPGFFLPISINFRNIIWLGICIPGWRRDELDAGLTARNESA